MNKNISAQELCKPVNDSYRVRKCTENLIDFLLKENVVIKHSITPYQEKQMRRPVCELWAYEVRVNWHSWKKSTLGNLLKRIEEKFKDVVEFTYFDGQYDQVSIRMKKENFIYRKNAVEWNSNE